MPFIEARAKKEKDLTKMENERIGLICATLQNGVAIGYKKGSKVYKPSDYFKSGVKKEDKKQPDKTQGIFNTMMAWVKATSKGGHR